MHSFFFCFPNVFTIYIKKAIVGNYSKNCIVFFNIFLPILFSSPITSLNSLKYFDKYGLIYLFYFFIF